MGQIRMRGAVLMAQPVDYLMEQQSGAVLIAMQIGRPQRLAVAVLEDL